ncbi:MAG: hypothetical protein HY298_19065 [Verrucomicrobia bacterium]|nr:hypothetical protein [Verrucomicrobiota bacterium]
MVPEDWTATKTNFEVFHYNDVFLTVNSKRPGLIIQMQKTHPGEFQFSAKTILQQMQPGEVYVSIGYFDGPGGPTMRPDSVINDLFPLLTTNHISASSEPGVSALHVRFFKRGHGWNISVYLREPVTKVNRRKVMVLLESFRFLDAPVNNVAWAEHLAWKQLPEAIRASSNWPVADYTGQQPQSGPRSVLVKKVDSGYSATFTVDGVGRWRYLIFESGKVVHSDP